MSQRYPRPRTPPNRDSPCVWSCPPTSLATDYPGGAGGWGAWDSTSGTGSRPGAATWGRRRSGSRPTSRSRPYGATWSGGPAGGPTTWSTPRSSSRAAGTPRLFSASSRRGWRSGRPRRPSSRSQRPPYLPVPRWCAWTATSRRSSGRSWRAATCGCGTCRSTPSPTPWGRTPGWSPSPSCSRAPAWSPTRHPWPRPHARTTPGCSSTPPRRPAGCRPPTSCPTAGPTSSCATPTSGCARRAAAAFAAFSDRALAEIRPLTAGWYSAADPWASCYGPALDLADDASRFDLSPAWHAWVGAEAALGFAVSLDPDEVRDHDVGLGQRVS